MINRRSMGFVNLPLLGTIHSKQTAKEILKVNQKTGYTSIFLSGIGSNRVVLPMKVLKIRIRIAYLVFAFSALSQCSTSSTSYPTAVFVAGPHDHFSVNFSKGIKN